MEGICRFHKDDKRSTMFGKIMGLEKTNPVICCRVQFSFMPGTAHRMMPCRSPLLVALILLVSVRFM